MDAGPADVEGTADEVLARAYLLVNHRQQTSASAKAARLARQVGSSLAAVKQLLEESLVVAVLCKREGPQCCQQC